METRRFRISKVVKSAQKNNTGKQEKTTFDPKKIYTGTPERAARKAFTDLCKSKAVKGQCTLNVTVEELGPRKVPLTRSDGSPKEKTYSLRRVKLDVPIEREVNGAKWELKYKTEARSTSDVCKLGTKLRRCKIKRSQ